jgi:hypothetical protein
MSRALVQLGTMLLAVLIVIQFIPKPRTNPPATRDVRWNEPATRALAQRATFLQDPPIVRGR